MLEFEDSKLYQLLRYAKHGIFVWIGTGQHGKTVGVNVFANHPLFADRQIVLINYPPEFVDDNYPSNYRAEYWPDSIDDVVDILRPSRDFVIIDDAAWLVGSRDSGTRENKDIQKLMTIASHHELFVAVTIQNTSMMDISMFQSQDVYMMHKHMDPIALEFERPMTKTRQIVANVMLQDYRYKYPKIHPKAFTYCSTTWEMLQMPMPDWWTSKHSKPYYGRIPRRRSSAQECDA